MKCPTCEAPLSQGVNYCPACGHNMLQTHHSYMDGVRAFCEGNYEEALRKFRVALLTDPTNTEIARDLGHAYLQNGDLTQALDMYDKAEILGESFAEIDYNRALIRLRNGHREESRMLFQRAVEKPPEIRPGRFYLGLTFRSQDEFLCECYLHLGTTARDLEDRPGAIAYFTRALELNERSVGAHQQLAELHLLDLAYDKALPHLERVLELTSVEEERINAHNNLGIACYECGRFEDAVKHLTWVLQHEPGNPSAVHNLNHIYEREGVFKKSHSVPHALRFMDVIESASPIFELSPDGAGVAAGGAGVCIIGKSQEMLRVMRHARLAAAADSAVLVTGENGTGKELLARAIYLNSPRRDQPYVVVNCASIPETLLESDLFGHEKGAFTGAHARKMGRFELANKGTLFLDEVAEISPYIQIKLLRAVQEREITPLGGTRAIPVDVRIIAATNRDLLSMSREGKFREDLYYRLNVLPIRIPPLRERPDDIPLLVDYFLRKYSRRDATHPPVLSREDMGTLLEYHWPGNIRELENMIERAVVMGSQSSLYLEELGRLKKMGRKTPRPIRKDSTEESYPLDLTLDELERRYILAVLQSTNSNQRAAAKRLGINPSTLWRKLKTYGVESPPT